jgi:pyruvate/2-oxoglutarate dehydrogenase complex dihydrolipoamide acyltransferase (E2) component
MKKPVVVDDTKIEIRDMMTCVYTFDHRQGDAAVLI